MLLVGNESFVNAERDIEILTGVKIPHSTQHRQVFSYQLPEPKITSIAKALSVDGGSVRIRTPLGQKSEWKNYKAINIHEQVGMAFYQDNQALLKWVNQQPLSRIVTCLGDGHDGGKEYCAADWQQRAKKRNFRLVSFNGKSPQSGRK